MKNSNNKFEIMAYLFVGVLTTLVNIISFYLLNSLLDANYVLATTIAWILSIMFAFIANKRFVFQSENSSIQEILPFLTYRFLSYIIDVGLMIILIEFLHFASLTSKIAVNVLVVLFNYVASKYLVFNDKTYSSAKGGE